MLEVCIKCVCNKCVNDVDNCYSQEGKFSCFNCDECYYYSSDDRLSKNIKFKCDNFQTSNYQAEKNRYKLLLVKK